MLNMKIVAAEIMRTVIGSVGLVMVAPLTALIAGFILTWRNDSVEKDAGLILRDIETNKSTG